MAALTLINYPFCALTYFNQSWPQMFKRWIALSAGLITRETTRETNCAIHSIEFYLR